MLSLRTAARTQLRSLRIAPTMSARGYADGGDNFKQREQAEEGNYVRKQEALKLAKLKESLATNAEEKKKIEAQVKELEAKAT